MENKEEVRQAIKIGMLASLRAVVKVRGQNFTREEKEAMRDQLKQRIFDQLTPYFKDDGWTKPEAVELINNTVNEILVEF